VVSRAQAARVRAAVLWAGDGAVLAGLAAAWWHGLVERAPRDVGLTVPRRCPAPRPGVTVRRQPRPPDEVVVVRGVAVSVRPLAALEAAVEAGAAGPALLARLPTADRAALAALAGRRCRGTAALLLGQPARNGSGSGIATVSCEYRTHPRGRPGPHVPFPRAR
jgi:hypothetical protein